MQTGDPGFSFRSFFRCTAIFALLLLLGYGAQALQLGQETSSPTERVVHVHGIVLNALTEMPIGRALVTAREAAAMTNGDGRFDFNLKFPPPSAAGGSIPGLGGRGTGGREIQVAVMARRPG